MLELTLPKKKPLMITLVGQGGIGKTSLGALFPNPVIIPIEDGTMSLIGKKVAVFPKVNEVADVFKYLQQLLEEEHDLKTVILDSITKLDEMAQREVVDSDPKAKSIITAMGGYGAGYRACSLKHQNVKRLCDKLKDEKGMNVVFIAHEQVEKVTPPDGDEYTRYSIRMNDKSTTHYTDDVDIVGFVKMKTYTSEKKAMTDGSRIITCYPIPNHISKNRVDITDDLVFEMGENPFEKYTTK